MTRNAKWDNMRGFLIILVVFGHVTEKLVTGKEGLSGLWLWIYSFHMPAFFLLTGMLTAAKASRDASKRRDEGTSSAKYLEKGFFYFKLGILVKVLKFLVEAAFYRKYTFSFFFRIGDTVVCLHHGCLLSAPGMSGSGRPKRRGNEICRGSIADPRMYGRI